MLFDDEDWNYLHQVLNNEGLLVVGNTNKYYFIAF